MLGSFGLKSYLWFQIELINIIIITFYLSVIVFSTAVLIGDTVNKETNIVNKQKLVKNPNW